MQGQPMMRLALGLLQLQAAAGVTGSINLHFLFFSDCRLPYATMHRRRRVLVSPWLGLASLVCSSRLTSCLPFLAPPFPSSLPPPLLLSLSRVFPCVADPSTQFNPHTLPPSLLLIARYFLLPFHFFTTSFLPPLTDHPWICNQSSAFVVITARTQTHTHTHPSPPAYF